MQTININTRRKLSLEDLQDWSGSDSKQEVLAYLLSILNGEFSVEDAKQEILDYVE
jgi:hypothetical protein